ncbi:meiotic recombination protein REC114-like [Saccostrea cucullata]|uniref:meiotic recombination protein REC114-like n=1 Tax=Saccostrea cuccullata TaxID=36930 RepID=UPI002ED3DF85
MVWKIQRYARQKTVHKGGDTIEWDDFDDKQSPIELRIQQGNMTLIHGKTVRDSFSELKAISKGKATLFCAILVIYRLETHTHRFRVKFAGGENSCEQCAQQLSDFFPVKILPITVESSQQGEKEGKHDKEVVKGEITISKMAEVVNGRTASVKLSAAYDRAQSMNGTQLNTLIKLCLADPQFPAFVEEVEKELVKIKDEMKT